MSEYYNHTFSDEEWEAIEEEAGRLFRDSERRRGSIRGQVIQKEDHLHFWAAVAVQSRRAAPVVSDAVGSKVVMHYERLLSIGQVDKGIAMKAAITAALDPDNAN